MDGPTDRLPAPLSPTEPAASVSVGKSDTTVMEIGPRDRPGGDGRPPGTPRWMLALMAAVIAIALYWWFAQTQRTEEVALNATVTAVNQATATAEAASAAAAVAQATATAAQELAQATQQAPPPKPEEPKADAKGAPSAAGKWNMVTQTDQGATNAIIDVKIDGKKVTGTISSQMGDAPIAGEWVDGVLTFSMTMNGGGGSMELWFTAKLKDADNMTGEIDFGQGKLSFTATRAK